MLSESNDSMDPASFRETELFKKCQEMGIIPKSVADSERPLQVEEASPTYPSTHDPREMPESPREISNHHALKLNLLVQDMWCPACAWLIEEALKKSPGVLSAGCSFSTDRFRCEYDPVLTSPSKIVGTIDHLGYKASLSGDEMASHAKKREFVRFVVSAFLTVNVMMLSISLYSGFFTEFDKDTVRMLSWPIFIMAGVVLFYGGRNIYRRAWAGISSAAFSMETLITIGAFSAFFYSTFNLFAGSIHLYFDSAAMLISLVLLGKMLEGRAKGEVQEGLTNFFSLLPRKARVCSHDKPGGRYVSVRNLLKGDQFIVSDGEALPADGPVLEGSGTLDESSLTGETRPLERKIGDRVRSGSRVIHGILKVRAEGVGEESTLGQMIQIMEKALGEKTKLEGKTDRLLKWFVPIIIFLACGTAVGCLLYGLSYDDVFLRAITVMVIACPCSLGIAIPLARVAGVSLAGKKGILVRDFSAFERVEKLTTFVLDKTGTLTEGRWALQEIIPCPPFTERRILSMALSLESAAEHYVATEIKRSANKKNLQPVPMEKIRVFENGISGWIGKDELRIGSIAFMENDLETSGAWPLKEASEAKSQYSFVFMSYDRKPCGIFVFGDQIKPSAPSTMKQLKTMGYRLALVSGDGENTTKSIGKKIGIEEAYGGKMPDEKASFIETLQSIGNNRIAMVGDGINDAPALIRADLAIAVYSGSHLGKEAADITLMRGDPRQILDFLDLSRRVRRKVYQNLIFSFSYNVISIPVAMSGLLNPLIAVSAMILSSLTVIGNTLLLIKKDPRVQGFKGPSEFKKNI